MTQCLAVDLIATTVLERATQGTSSDIAVPAGTAVGDLLYLSVNKDDEDAGYVAAVIDAGDPAWTVLAGGQTDHFWKSADAGDVAPGATVHVEYGPGARYAVLTLATFRCASTTDPVAAYDTATTGLTDVTTHTVPGLTLALGDYFLVAGIELGTDDPGAITFPAGWATFGGGESPGGLGTVPTTSSAIAWKRFHGSNPASFNITTGNARHSGTWIVALRASIETLGWDVFAAGALLGERIATLTSARERMLRVEEDGPGVGGFTINRHSDEATAAVLAKGNLVRVRIPEISDAYIGAFFLETGDFEILSSGEAGDEELKFSGKGAFAYLNRARMWNAAYSTGLDVTDTWTEIWRTGAVANPVGSAVVGGDPTYVYVISATTRKIYKVRQSDRKVVGSSPALWSGSDNYAGGLGADPSDSTILWALEAPWSLGGSGNTKIRKVSIASGIAAATVVDTIDLGGATQLSAIKADAANLWTTRYSTDKIEKRSKSTGAVVDDYSIVYGGVTQTNPTGISVNGTKLAYWFEDTKRALIADTSDPATITDKIRTTGLSAFGGDWTTESGNDYFYPVSYTADLVWKYQVTSATPHDPVDGVWRLDEGTPGAIGWRIVTEATHASRPQQPVPDLVFSFTASLDSNGNAWDSHPGTAEFSANIGDYVDETLLRLVPFGVTWQMDPTTLELRGYNATDFGTDRTSGTFAAGKVRVEAGVNAAESLRRRMDDRRVDSHLLVTGDAGLSAVSIDDDLGYVREGFLSTNLGDAGALEGTGDAELARERRDSDAQAVAIPWGNDEAAGLYLPGPAGTNGHYWVGDTIRVHTGTGPFDLNEANRDVKAITIKEIDATPDPDTGVVEAGGWEAVADLAAVFVPIYDPVAPTGSRDGTAIGGTSGAGAAATSSTSGVTVKDTTNGESYVGRTIESEDWGVFQAGTGRVGVSVRGKRLVELPDVDAGNIGDGQVLAYDADEGAFVAADLNPLDVTDGETTVADVASLVTALGGVEDTGGQTALLRLLTDRYGGQAAYLNLGSVGSTATIDCAAATVFDLTLTEACAITLSNPAPSGVESAIRIILRGNFAVTWPAAVTFYDDGTGLATTNPDLTTLDADAQTVVELATVDGGTSWGAALPHVSGGGGSGVLEELTTAETDTSKVPHPDGAGGVAWGSVGTLALDLSSLTVERSIQGVADMVAAWDASASDERGFPVGYLARSRQHTIIGADMVLAASAAVSVNETMIDWPFRLIAGGSATIPSITSVVSDATHPGIVQLNTGSVATNRCALSTENYLGSFGRVRWISVLKIPTLSDATNRFSVLTGISNAVGSTAVGDGIAFRYSDNVNGGKWQAVVANGSETTADTGVAADTGWHTFEFEGNAAGTEVKFYIDGTLVTTITSTRSTSGGLRLQAASIVKSVGTTSRSVQVDMATAIYELASAR